MTDVQEPVTDVQDKTESPQEQADGALRRFADGFSWLRRAPVLHSPAEHGLDYEDVTFPARDGVPLEGWFIPAPGSGKLIIANHPMGFNRSGMPNQYEPWHADWVASGNGFEVDLVPDYKILHDAGYNVLAYDLRNHGLSSAANGGVSTHGITEWRDIAGSLTYARTRPGVGDMIIGLFSRCRSAATSSRTPVTSRRCSTTSRWSRRSCSGSRARRPDGTATWSSSAARSPCSTGSRGTSSPHRGDQSHSYRSP
ncbi:MAG TPA: hypothetical protein VJ351_21040, partial [Streptosporangiaceae bacterium]|nr:hypothetical protein [Streptosporangiaceae bacterium]